MPLPLLAAVSWDVEAASARGLAEARRLLTRRRSLRRRAADHERRRRHRAGLVARPAQDRLRSPGARQALLEPLRRPARRRRPAAADARRAGRRDARLARRRPPARLSRRARSQAAASTSTSSPSTAAGRTVVASGPTEQLAPALQRAARSGSGRSSRASRSPRRRATPGTPQSGPRELLPDFDQRAPFRLPSPERSSASPPRPTTSATARSGSAAAGRRASGPMVARQLVRLSDGTVRTYDDAGRLRYTYSPTHTHWHLLDFQRYELRTLDGELIVRDRKSGFCLADHYGLARRRVARVHRRAASSATAPPRTRRRSPSSRAPRPATPTSTPPTSTARTSSSAASRPGPTCSSTARTRPAARGDRLHEQCRVAPHPARPGRGGRRTSRRSAPARTQPTASGA